MYIRRVENLINDCRRETENEEFTATTGIQDTEFIRYLNDAQEDLQSAIARAHQMVFIKEAFIDVVANQEKYNLPDDIYLDNRITNVWFSDTGNTKDLRRLQAGSMGERVFDKSQNPAQYIRSSNQLILNPIPGTSVRNGLKLAYVKTLPKLDIRRATVESVTLDTVNRKITSLTFDVNVNFDRDALLEENYMCIVNRDGGERMQQIPILDIDANTGVAIIDSSFIYKEGEAIAAGDFAVRGRFSVNRSQLPTYCERYLIAYCNWKVFKRDSSGDSIEMTQELISMRNELVDIFNEIDDDVKTVAILNTQFLDDDDLFIYY